MIIKVCGMREPDNIRAVEALQLHATRPTMPSVATPSPIQPAVHWLGFIFWPKSSRYVAAPPAYLPTRCKRVGVFVDAAPVDVLQHVADYRLDAIQLHGHESPDYIRALRTACSVSRGTAAAPAVFPAVFPAVSPTAVPPAITAPIPAIIKAISVSTPADIALTNQYAALVDYFLFDTKCKTVGGSGQHFDWTVLADYVGEPPFLLSGGIGPDDADRLRAFHHPRCVGIDLNSRFETAPALKDINKLKQFLQHLENLEHPEK